MFSLTTNAEKITTLINDSVKIYLNILLQKIETLSNNIKPIETSIGFCSDSIDDFNV